MKDVAIMNSLAPIGLGVFYLLFSPDSFAFSNLASINDSELLFLIGLVVIGWPLLSWIVGFFWHKRQKEKWVWVISPFIVLNIPWTVHYLIMVFNGLISGFPIKRDFHLFLYLCLFLIFSVWLSTFVYKKIGHHRFAFFIPYIALPAVLILYWYMSITFLND